MITAEDLKRQIPTPDVIARDLYSIDWRHNQARCPFSQNHNNGDKNPSLRYDPSKKLIFCASQGCFGAQGSDAFALVMKMERCKFPEAKRKLQEHYLVANGNGRSKRPQQTPEKNQTAAHVRADLENSGFKAVAEFRYSDGLRKVRFEHGTKMQAGKPRPEKTFRWEHRGCDGVWYSGDGGMEKPAYLNQAANERDQAGLILGLEGEGKADLAGELGFAAFSYKDLSEDAARALADWDVVLWPDADPTGSRNCTKAVELITKAGARSVAIAQPPPDIQAAGDIVDAVQGLGWTAADISRLIAGAKQVSPARPRGIQSISKIPLLRECGAKEVEYLIEPVLPAGAVVAITGDSGSGKSTLVSKWAGQVAASGQPVLVLDKENSISVVLDRFKRLAISDGPMLHYWGGWLPDEAPQPASPIVLNWVSSCHPRPLVIVDSLIAFHGGDENDAAAMRAFMHQCRKLADMGATVVVIHHDGKAESAKDFRGSSDFKAAVDVAFHVSNSSDDGRLATLRLRCFKSRFGFAGELVYHYADGQFIRDEDRNAGMRTASEQLTDLLRGNPGIDAKAFEELASKRGLGRNRARTFLNDGLVTRTIRRETGSRNTKHHFLVTNGGENQ